LPPLPSIIIGLAGGLLFGLISGVAVGRFKLPDMIATIAIGSTAWGLAYLYSNGNYIYKNFLTSGIISFSDGKLFGIPYPVIYLFAFYILGYILLHMTAYGRRFYATGSNKIAAAFSGVKVEAYIIAAFAICSFMASFTNIMLTAAQGNGNVKGGLVLLMPAWAAVFVGISVFRKPTVIGTFFGAFLIAIMQNGFTLLNAPFYIMDLIVGLTLIGAILVSKIQIRNRVESTVEMPPVVETATTD
jgi:simple sugar transport system permease protein/ribose transport system permease protein